MLYGSEIALRLLYKGETTKLANYSKEKQFFALSGGVVKQIDWIATSN